MREPGEGAWGHTEARSPLGTPWGQAAEAVLSGQAAITSVSPQGVREQFPWILALCP